MKTILSSTVLDVEEYKFNIDKLSKSMPYDFSKEELFDGLSNEDIKSTKFEEKVYEIPFWYSLEAKIGFSSENYLDVFVELQGEWIKIGRLQNELRDKMKDLTMQTDAEFSVKPMGGRYKLATVKDDGSEIIKTYREPYSFELMVRRLDEDDLKIKSMQSQTAKTENFANGAEKFGNSMQKVGNGCQTIGCFIFGLPLGIFCIYLIYQILFNW